MIFGIIEISRSGKTLRENPYQEILGSKESTHMQLLCPFECGGDPFKTQSDQKYHLKKKHACTDKQLTLAAAQSSSSKGENETAQNSPSKDPNSDYLEEREANEKNNIRKPMYQTQNV